MESLNINAVVRPKIKRAPKIIFEQRDVELLIECALKERDILENKRTDNPASQMKNDAWIRITDDFNANTTGMIRTINSLREKYTKLKGDLRKIEGFVAKHAKGENGGKLAEKMQALTEPYQQLTSYASHHFLKADRPVLKKNILPFLEQQRITRNKRSSIEAKLSNLRVQQAREKHEYELSILQLRNDEIIAKVKLAELRCNAEKYKMRLMKAEMRGQKKEKGSRSNKSDEFFTTHDTDECKPPKEEN